MDTIRKVRGDCLRSPRRNLSLSFCGSAFGGRGRSCTSFRMTAYHVRTGSTKATDAARRRRATTQTTRAAKAGWRLFGFGHTPDTNWSAASSIEATSTLRSPRRATLATTAEAGCRSSTPTAASSRTTATTSRAAICSITTAEAGRRSSSPTPQASARSAAAP